MEKIKIKIAIIECFPNRANNIKNLVRKVGSNLSLKIFQIYKNKFPDNSFDAYIYSGGSIRVLEKEKYPYLIKLERLTRKLSKLNKPLLGICLGHQIIADTFGGKISEANNLEVGFQKIEVIKTNNLFKDLPQEFYTFNYHWDYVSKLPEDFENIAKSEMCEVHSIKHIKKPIFGIQFHIEFNEKLSKDVLNYLKNEIIEEELDYNKLLKNTCLYSEEISKQIIKNFLDTVYTTN